MTNVTYNLDIPDGPNNPSDDQPLMKVNTNAVNTILNVDHIGFNDNDGGLHQQVTFNDKNAAGAQTDPESVLYTGSGTASSVSQLLYRNQNGIFQISAIRAWGYVNGATGAIINSQSYNVSSVVRNSAGYYSITLTANSVSSADFAVFACCTRSAANAGLTPNYTITGATTFDLRTLLASSAVDCSSFTFAVIQI